MTIVGTRIVLVDSGLNSSHKMLENISISSAVNFASADADVADYLGHGTAITSIIFSIDQNAEFNIIKIYDKELITDERVFLETLKYIAENLEFDILHLSLGAKYFNSEVYKICKSIVESGALIIAAFDNSGCISYPAAFDFVIGVEASDLCTRATDFYIPLDEVVSVYAKGGVHRVAWINSLFSIQQGSSLSAAYVTGYLSKVYKKGIVKANALSL